MTDISPRIPKSRRKEPPRGAYRWIGRSMKRVEDPRLLTGCGTYIDDIHLPNMAHAAMLRSPHAHAAPRRRRRPAPCPASPTRR